MSSTTPSLLINSLKYSGTTEGSQIKLNVAVVPELRLGTILLAKGKSKAATSGKLAKGTEMVPGIANVIISAELYDRIISDAGFTQAIEVEYTGKSLIVNIFIGPV